MKHIIVTFFCTFLSTGYLQNIDNENNYQYHPENAMKEQVFEPEIVQGYQTFRGNFYARRSINPNCVKPSSPQNVNSRERGLIALERPMKNQLVPLPTRRTSYVDPKRKSINNMESTYLQPPLKNELPTLVTQTQYLKPNALRSQPQNVKEVEPTTFRIKTTTVKDEETGTFRSPTQVLKNYEDKLIKAEPQDSTNEHLNALRTRPDIVTDEESNTFRTETKVSKKLETNLLRSQPEAPENEGSNKFRIQPPDSKEEIPCKTETQVLSNDNSNLLRAGSDVSIESQSPASTDNEKAIDDNSLVSVSEEHTGEEEPKNLRKSEPAYTVEQVESYSIERSTEHLASPSVPLDSMDAMAKIHCSNGNNGDVSIPERRVLMNTKNSESKWIPNVERNEFLALNNINRPKTSVLSTKTNINRPEISVLNTKTSVLSNKLKALNPETGVSSQNDNISMLNTKLNEIRSNEIVPENAVKITNDISAQRQGKVQFFADPTNNEIKDPTKGQGISYIQKTTLMLMDYDRVCYACSTANSPTCLFPDRRTGVKYCRKGDNACVTKTFGSGSTLTLIRDCAKSCDDSEPGFAPNYKSCGICHADLCNSAHSINVHSLILTLPTLAILVLVKPLL